MKLKKLMATVLTLALAVSVTACGGNGASESSAISEPAASTAATDGGLQTVEKGKLTIAMEAQYPPFNWTQVDDSNNAAPIKGTNTFANGYDIQMAQLVAKELGLELQVVKLPWDSLSPAVQSGTADLVMAGMSPTAERRKTVNFSDPYYLSQLVVVVKEDSPYAQAKTKEDFKDAKVTAQVNTFHATALKQLTAAKIQEPMKDFSTMREALKSGIIDGYVSEKVEGLSAQNAIKGFTFVEFDEANAFETDPNDVAIAAAVKKGNDALMEAVNNVLKKISNEDREALMEKAIKEQPAA